MSHEQVPNAVAVSNVKKAEEMQLATHRSRIKSTLKVQAASLLGPIVVNPPKKRAAQRHEDERLTKEFEDLQAVRGKKGVCEE